MELEKPITLINLLIELRDEKVKSNYETIYLKIIKETLRVEFEHNPVHNFDWFTYKRLIQLSVKDFIFLGQTEESIANLNWLINFLQDTPIING